MTLKTKKEKYNFLGKCKEDMEEDDKMCGLSSKLDMHPNFIYCLL